MLVKNKKKSISNVVNSLEDLNILRTEHLSKEKLNKIKIIICHGTGCIANGSQEVTKAITKALIAKDVKAEVIPSVKKTGCNGFCSRGPLVVIEPDGLFYQKVSPKDANEIVEKTIIKREPINRLLYKEPNTGKSILKEKDIPFYKLQTRFILQNIGKVDPTDIKDSIAYGGYRALIKVITTMSSDEVIQEIKKSGLRGRGGGGFPTGRKWQAAVNAVRKKGKDVYVVVNGDEGDPGAFMDRTIMEGDPHAVLEGFIIGAYALGSKKGFLYIRAEYPLAVQNIGVAIKQARKLGLLGENILGTNFSFEVKIHQGAGAFVCGESTALFTSIEGRAGNPRPKYVRSVEEGLWGNPTILNNVETWANIPLIINKGSKWFSKIGVPNNTGTKIFSLVGKVNNIGLVEVPMGISLETIVEKIGGGVPGNTEVKAIQTGGPSGGCLPYSLRNISVDFDSLSAAGSMMGSGGMIIMDEKDCVVDISCYFLKFLEEESCGKCLPCRLGLPRLREILEQFSKGKGNQKNIDDLLSLSKVIQDSSLCALGRSAPNPIITTIKYFKDEYLAHIKDHKCPAAVCKDLITYKIDNTKCTGCHACAIKCPQNCISGEKKEEHKIESVNCIRCGICKELCNFDAISIE